MLVSVVTTGMLVLHRNILCYQNSYMLVSNNHHRNYDRTTNLNWTFDRYPGKSVLQQEVMWSKSQTGQEIIVINPLNLYHTHTANT